MTTNLEAFLQRFVELGGDASRWARTDAQFPTLILPALHDDVGPLSIDDNGDELTIELNEKHHTHFSGYNYDGESAEQRMIAAVHDAARFAFDVLSDRICFTVDFIDGRCVGSSHFYLEAESTTAETVRDTIIGTRGGNIRSDRYLWSTPLQ